MARRTIGEIGKYFAVRQGELAETIKAISNRPPKLIENNCSCVSVGVFSKLGSKLDMRAATTRPSLAAVPVVMFLIVGMATLGYAAPQSEASQTPAARQLGEIKGMVIDVVTKQGLVKLT